MCFPYIKIVLITSLLYVDLIQGSHCSPSCAQSLKPRADVDPPLGTAASSAPFGATGSNAPVVTGTSTPSPARSFLLPGSASESRLLAIGAQVTRACARTRVASDIFRDTLDRGYERMEDFAREGGSALDAANRPGRRGRLNPSQRRRINRLRVVGEAVTAGVHSLDLLKAPTNNHISRMKINANLAVHGMIAIEAKQGRGESWDGGLPRIEGWAQGADDSATAVENATRQAMEISAMITQRLGEEGLRRT